MKYFKNRKFARQNKENMKTYGLSNCRVLGWDFFTGKIKVKVFDSFRGISYNSLVDFNQLTTF